MHRSLNSDYDTKRNITDHKISMNFSLKIVLNQLVILSILCSNLVWAADTHKNSALFNADEASYQQASHVQNSTGYEASDHSCHGAKHFSAILLPTINVAYQPQYNPVSGEFVSFHSIVLTPPTPPPTA